MHFISRSSGLNISLVIYCQDSQALLKIHELVGAYAPFFAQCLILLNIPSSTPLPILFPPELRRVSVLQMPDRIDAGAAMGKMFSHIHFQKVFLVDSRVELKKEVLSLLRHSESYDFDSVSSIISFQPQIRHMPWDLPERIGERWNADFRFVTTLSWGALLFDKDYVLGLGGFDPQLSEESLIVDLSWKAQQSPGLLLESYQEIAVLKEDYVPLSSELRHLADKYPRLYPSWRSFFQKIWSKVFQESSQKSRELN